METCGGVKVQIHVFLTSALDGGELSASRLCRFTPGERFPATHCIGDWVGPRACLDNMEEVKFLDPTGNHTPAPRSSVP
jgi:hypothetical protein